MLVVGNRSFETVDDLEKLVIFAASQYEISGYAEDMDGVEITDPEYDDLFRELKSQKPSSEAFSKASPAQLKATGNAIKHDPPMTSINKADGDEAKKVARYDRWIEDCASRLQISTDQLKIAQSYKHDGVALRVNYVKGKLASAGLRSEGDSGTDVTHHMKNIIGIPTKLNLPLTLSLNGEIECWHDDFKIVNAERDAAGEDQYKNPRAYTIGCMGRDDPDATKNSRLRVAFYSITGFDDWSNYYTTEVERAKWCNSPDGLKLQDKDGNGCFVQVRPHEFKHLAMMEEHAKKLPYYTDGIVLKVDNLEWQEELGHTGDSNVNPPRGAIAWKFVEETAEATVSSVEWNASRTGNIVPTALFDIPFVLADTENSRATCNNYGWMQSQGLGPGAVVLCKKGGKIIPNIMKVLVPVKDVGAPTHCPTCSSKLNLVTSNSGNINLTCPNSDCGAKHVKSWIFYIQKLGGKGLGLAAMEKILSSGKVKTLADLYKLTINDLLEAGFSDRQALLALATIFLVKPIKDDAKLAAEIEKARASKQTVEAWKFFSALGIHGAGETAGKALVKHFGDFDKIASASKAELVSIDGIGVLTAEAIHDWFAKGGTQLAKELLKQIDLEMPKTGTLTGKNFCLTGSFSLGKSHWKQEIEDRGGNVQSSVGKTTSYLVQEHGKDDGSPSEKEVKAAKLGVDVISVKELEKLL